MKVLVVDNFVPFAAGYADALANNLVINLQRTAGVSAELLRIPVSRQGDAPLAEEVMLCRMMELRWVDRVIGLTFPSYLIPHHRKTVWMQDRIPEARDQLNNPTASQSSAIRTMAERADYDCLAAAKAIFVNSLKAQEHLRGAHGFEAIVLPPPLVEPERFVNRETGDYIFAGGRISAGNRQKLLIQALKLCRSGVRLIIAGPPDTDADGQALHAASADPALQGRLTVDLGVLDRGKLADYVGNALACADLAVDDGGSDVAMAACQAAKSMLTTTDSVDPHGLVRDQATGLVAEARADCLADAMDCLFQDKPRAEELGRAGQALWRERNVTWRATIERLLS